MRHTVLLAALLLVGCASAAQPVADIEDSPEPFAGEVVSPSDVFLALGDSRRGFFVEGGDELDIDGHRHYAERLRDERPAFVVHLGDIARTGSDEEEWEYFDRDFAPLREAGIPMFPVLGNHEYRGANGKALEHYFARFEDLGHRRFYVRNFRGIRLLFLDSNTDDLGEPRAQRELQWLARRLDEAEADDSVRAVFVALHHPPFTNRVRAGESDWTRDGVLPLMTAHPKARMLLAGHVHSYEHFLIDGVHCVVSGGGGSPLHDLRDASDPGTRPDLYRGPRNFHYLKIRAGARILVDVMMMRPDGSWFLADRWEL